VNVALVVVDVEPAAGPPVMVVLGGVVSPWTVQLRLAGVASVLPAASMARTRKVWVPVVSPVYERGELQAAYAVVESSEHWNVDPLSLALNVNVALVLVVVEPAAGPPVMVVLGGAMSTVHVRLAALGSVLPAASIARTRNVWLPPVSPVYWRGEVQVLKAVVESSEHWNVEPGSVELNAKEATVAFVRAAGPLSIAVSGGVTSAAGPIVHVRLAAESSTLPVRSVARTLKVCVPFARAVYSCGVTHAAYAPASSAHENVDPGSVEVNVKLALVLVVVVPAVGPPVIVVSGGTVSIVQVRLAGDGSALPEESVALTEKVWTPSPKPAYCRGDPHATTAPPSSAQLKVEPASVDEKAKVATVAFVLPVGPVSMVVSGGVVSAGAEIVHVWTAADGSALPAASVARTANSWEPSASPA
jgi:hypothetical protein